MSAELVQLVVEIDITKAGAAAKRMKDEFGAAVKDMDRESQRTQRSVENIGGGAQSAAKFGAMAMRSMSAAIGAATAAAAAQQRSWLTLGTTILASFAAGGPVAGAIAAVGAGIGLLTGETEQATKAARDAQEATTRWLGESAEKARVAREEIQRLNDETKFNRDLAAGRTPTPLSVVGRGRDVEAAQAEAEKAAAAFAGKFPGLGLGQRSLIDVIEMVRGNVPADGRMSDLLAEDGPGRALVDAVHRLDDAERALAATRRNEGSKAAVEMSGAEKTRADRATKTNDALREEIRLLGAKTELERDVLSLLGKRQTEVAAGADPTLADAAMRARFGASLKADNATATATAAREAAGWWERLAKSVEDADRANVEISRSSAAYLDNLRSQGVLLTAATDEERDRLKIEQDIAAALAAGTLAVEDANAAFDIATANAKKRRDDAASERERKDAERLAEARDRATESVRRQLRYLQAATDIDRELLAIEDQIADLRKEGVPENLLSDLRSQLVQKAATSLRGNDPVVSWLREIQPTISGGLTSAIVDGLTNGFRNGTDIARQLVNTLLSQTVGSLVNTGLSALGGLFGGGGGAASTITSVVGAFTGGGTASVSGAGFSPLPSFDTGFT